MSPGVYFAIAHAGAGLAIGFIVGTSYFTLLWQNTRAVVEGHSIARAAVLQFLRLALVGGALAITAIYGGALALIAAAVAIAAARKIVLRRLGARS